MNLFLIWLIISTVSMVIVLISIRCAPLMEDERLDRPQQTSLRVDRGHRDPPADEPRGESGERSEFRRLDQPTEKRASNFLSLGSFPAGRSKEGQL